VGAWMGNAGRRGGGGAAAGRRHALPLGALCLLAGLAGAAGCDNRADMYAGGHLKPYGPTAFFGDDSSARPPVPGTVPWHSFHGEDPVYTGMAGGRAVLRSPVPFTPEVVARGRERFLAFCSPCHGADGYGQGMIVRRGYPTPPSYHQPRLIAAPDGHFFDVMTNGFGRMASYADQVPPGDRWAIVAYIRALQLSQHAAVDDLPAADRNRLGEGTQR
jgi:mono/diheme cytochrome c family protein